MKKLQSIHGEIDVPEVGEVWRYGSDDLILIKDVQPTHCVFIFCEDIANMEEGETINDLGIECYWEQWEDCTLIK